jgi:hypothetical protein
MSQNPNTTVPANVPVLILMPGFHKHKWRRAVLTEQNGRRGLRWRVYDDAGRSWVYSRDFQPLDWMPIVPENGGVQ